MPRGTALRNFRCDDARWEAFLEACAEEGTDASKKIRDMIDGVIDVRLVGVEHQALNNCIGNMHPGPLRSCKVPGCGEGR